MFKLNEKSSKLRERENKKPIKDKNVKKRGHINKSKDLWNIKQI